MSSKLLSKDQARIDDIIASAGANHKDISDGHHTFAELYDFRQEYNAALFNMWHRHNPEYEAHKSKCHYGGGLCFGGGWFVVSAKIPGIGLITNHYRLEYWDHFQIPEELTEKWPFDGTSPANVLERLRAHNLSK